MVEQEAAPLWAIVGQCGYQFLLPRTQRRLALNSKTNDSSVFTSRSGAIHILTGMPANSSGIDHLLCQLMLSNCNQTLQFASYAAGPLRHFQAWDKPQDTSAVAGLSDQESATGSFQNGVPVRRSYASM